MANLDHLTILKRGVAAWNRWRQENPAVTPNLAGVEFDRTSLRRVNLAGAHLDGARLAMSNLAEANLREASLHDADLSGSNIQRADLGGADLTFANLSKSNLTGVNLGGAKLRGADLHDSNLTEVPLSRLDLRGANLRDAVLVRANLSMADLDSANLSGADLSEAMLIGATLTIADLANANLAGASLQHARLGGAELTGARLYGTIRDGWHIQRVKCRYAYFDPDGTERTPANRDYLEGEFARLFGIRGTFAFAFQKEVSFAELVALNHAVLRTGEAHPDWDLRIHSLGLRGTGEEAVLSFDESRAGQAEVRAEVGQEFRKMQREVEAGLRQLDQLPECRSLSRSLREPVWLDLGVADPASPEGGRAAADLRTIPRPEASPATARHDAPE